MALIAILALALLLPLILRLLRLLVTAYVWMFLLFLPAGLLLRLGPREDMRVFFGVTAIWGAILLLWRLIRRRRRRAEARRRPGPRPLRARTA